MFPPYNENKKEKSLRVAGATSILPGIPTVRYRIRVLGSTIIGVVKHAVHYLVLRYGTSSVLRS